MTDPLAPDERPARPVTHVAREFGQRLDAATYGTSVVLDPATPFPDYFAVTAADLAEAFTRTYARAFEQLDALERRLGDLEAMVAALTTPGNSEQPSKGA